MGPEEEEILATKRRKKNLSCHEYVPRAYRRLESSNGPRIFVPLCGHKMPWSGLGQGEDAAVAFGAEQAGEGGAADAVAAGEDERPGGSEFAQSAEVER